METQRSNQGEPLRPHWTTMDLIKLKMKLRAGTLTDAYAAFPDRTREDVYLQATRNGFYKPCLKENFRPWVEEEDDLLREHLLEMGAERLACEFPSLERNAEAIKNRGFILGILFPSTMGRRGTEVQISALTGVETKLIDDLIHAGLKRDEAIKQLVTLMPHRTRGVIRHHYSARREVISPSKSKNLGKVGWTPADDSLLLEIRHFSIQTISRRLEKTTSDVFWRLVYLGYRKQYSPRYEIIRKAAGDGVGELIV